MESEIKRLIPTIPIKKIHPFEMAVRNKIIGGIKKLVIAVSYHSSLYTLLEERGSNSDIFYYKKLFITGLDFEQNVPDSFPSKKYYCVLNVTVNNLTAQSAKIEWVEDDEEKLAPIKFSSGNDKRQTEARIIIGVLVRDKEASPGFPDSTSVPVAYIIQYINTNLMMCNMVFNGVPVIYPVPFGGGRIDS